MRVRADDDAGPGGGQLPGQRQLAGSGQAWPSVPQCMNTMTVGASRLAARTAARVRLRSIAFASPGRLGVATQDDASSATWETPMTAIRVPLTVVTYGAHAAAASVADPHVREPGCPGRRQRVRQAGVPVVQDMVVGHRDQVDAARRAAR